MEKLLLEDKSVLVAEDNVINQLLVKHCLQALGAKLEIAGDGQEAIEKFQQNSFDVILMDIQMPNLDGYETTVYIRNQLKSEIPIIAMTAFALQGEDEKCYDVGMNGYLSKPFTVEALAATLEKVLNTPTTTSSNPYILSTPDVMVDVSMLYEVAGNDEAYINIMVTTFLENLPASIARMEAFLRDKDYDNLWKAAHYTKSSLSVIKISDARLQVEKIELSAKYKTGLEEIELLLDEVKKKFSLAEQLLLTKYASIV